VRRPGGGGRRQKKRPEVIEAIGRLMEHDTAGDPVSGVKWTRRTTGRSPPSWARPASWSAQHRRQALEGLGYRLRANAKKLNRQKDPGRDAQFVYIAAMRESFAQAGLPVVSVDSKTGSWSGTSRTPVPPGKKSPSW